jgi:hypothetical protein
MALSNALISSLRHAIQDYDFPFVTFDYRLKLETQHQSMRQVEAVIQQQLRADKLDLVKDGLSNVLYWGYARTGYRWTRINDLRANVTEQQLADARQVLGGLTGPGVRKIAKLKIPQLSGLSFVSKVRMFLDPTNYVVLDTKLLKLHEQARSTVFHRINWNAGTSIYVSEQNEAIYDEWCALCRRAAKNELGVTDVRAADVERGIFHLIQLGETELAAEIVASI